MPKPRKIAVVSLKYKQKGQRKNTLPIQSCYAASRTYVDLAIAKYESLRG